MRFSYFVMALLPASASVYAGDPKPFMYLNLNILPSRSFEGVLLQRDSCSQQGLADCGDGCIPMGGATCCGQDGHFCISPDTCVNQGCCEPGQRCDGIGAGTSIYDGPNSIPTAAATSGASSGGSGFGAICNPGYVACGDGCIPSSGTCCPDSKGGCLSDEYCVKPTTGGDYGCCPKGEICSGSDSGGGNSGGSGGSGGSSSGGGGGSSSGGTSVGNSGSASSSSGGGGVVSGVVSSVTKVYTLAPHYSFTFDPPPINTNFLGGITFPTTPATTGAGSSGNIANAATQTAVATVTASGAPVSANMGAMGVVVDLMWATAAFLLGMTLL